MRRCFPSKRRNVITIEDEDEAKLRLLCTLPLWRLA